MDVRGLADAMLLDVADQAAALDRPWRELALLATASGETLERLGSLSIGERDRLLLRVHAQTFGPKIDCEMRCEWCGARLELTLDASRLTGPTRAIDPADLDVITDGYTVRVRLPDSRDVAVCRDDGPRASERLFARCVIVIEPAGVSAADLPASVRDAVMMRMASLDPEAEIRLDVECDVCGRQSQPIFDAAAVVMAELDARAARLLEEVDTLARAYGWREADVLALGPARRRRYLQLAMQ